MFSIISWSEVLLTSSSGKEIYCLIFVFFILLIHSFLLFSLCCLSVTFGVYVQYALDVLLPLSRQIQLHIRCDTL